MALDEKTKPVIARQIVVRECDECPFSALHDGDWYCQIEEAQQCPPTEFSPPDWCPLATAAVLVELHKNSIPDGTN